MPVLAALRRLATVSSFHDLIILARSNFSTILIFKNKRGILAALMPDTPPEASQPNPDDDAPRKPSFAERIGKGKAIGRRSPAQPRGEMHEVRHALQQAQSTMQSTLALTPVPERDQAASKLADDVWIAANVFRFAGTSDAPDPEKDPPAKIIAWHLLIAARASGRPLTEHGVKSFFRSVREGGAGQGVGKGQDSEET